MRKIFLLSLYLGFAFCTHAQQNEGSTSKEKIGITFSSFGENDVVRYQPLEGEASYNSDGFYTIGINYLHRLNKTFDFETGLEYSRHKIIIDPMDFPFNIAPSHKEQFSLINIPLTFRVNFLKHIFVNGGLNLDIDPTISSPVDSQNGIGAIIGIGLKYDSDFGISVFVNPYTKAHSLISFSADDNHQRLLETGFRFGVMYTLK